MTAKMHPIWYYAYKGFFLSQLQVIHLIQQWLEFLHPLSAANKLQFYPAPQANANRQHAAQPHARITSRGCVHKQGQEHCGLLWEKLGRLMVSNKSIRLSSPSERHQHLHP